MRHEARRAADLIDTALKHDSDAASWQGYRDRAILLEAAIAGRIGDHAQALRLDQDVLHRLQAHVDTASNTEPFWLLQRCRLQTGDELAELGRLTDAREDWGAIANSLSGPVESYEPMASGYSGGGAEARGALSSGRSHRQASEGYV